MGKAVLIVLTGSILLLSSLVISTSLKREEARQSVVSNHVENQSRNICHSMLGMLASTIADSLNYRVKQPLTRKLFNGTATFTVRKVFLSTIADSAMEVNVTGIFYGDTSNVLAYVKKPYYIPASTKAAITTNNDIGTLGNIMIDGRNHDLNGNLISKSGTYGIWTTQNFSQGGTSDIGGTDDIGTDYAPSDPGDPAIIKTNQVYTGGFPDTPDKVMGGASKGFPEGTLKNIAMSGINGSQFVTDPYTTLTYPLRGVTYVELPTQTKGNQNAWIDANIQGSGILIVHNNLKNAILKTCINTFKGLIIADDIDKVDATIIGAISGLTPAPASGNCVGNSQGKVLFSRRAIGDATSFMINDWQEYGYGKQRLEIVHLYE